MLKSVVSYINDARSRTCTVSIPLESGTKFNIYSSGNCMTKTSQNNEEAEPKAESSL